MTYRDYRDAELEKLRAEVLTLKEDNEKLRSTIHNLIKAPVSSPARPRRFPLPAVEKSGVFTVGGSFSDWFR
jgi:hypothetical protein